MYTCKRRHLDSRGSVAVEFAIIAMVAITLIVFILCAGLTLYLNQTLDYATAQASRQIITGSAQSKSFGISEFRASLCGFLPRTMECGNVTINLYVVPKAAGPSGFYRFVNSDLSGLSIPNPVDGAGQFNLGARGDFQYLQVIYPITFAPSTILSWLSGGATFRGSPAYLAISTAAFRNEQF